MAHLNVSLDFDSESEQTNGTGWRVINWLDDGSGTPDETQRFTNLYLTITEAQTAIEDLFSADPEVDQFFHAKAVADLVESSESTLDAAKQALRIAEGLDAEPPPVGASGATAGVPGTWTPDGSIPPATVADLQTGMPFTVLAEPPDPWATGEYVQTATAGAAGEAFWDGDTWEPGRAP
jgi:hypothetical protein